VGKSRLAQQWALSSATSCDLVDLAELTDPELLPHRLAVALDLQCTDPLRHLPHHLKDEPRTIVLDNCEQLAGACATLAVQLLRACGGLRIVTTSRQALAVPGEQQLVLVPLDVPPDDCVGVDRLMAYDAAKLLVERARAVQPGFAVTAATAPLIRAICRRTDGLPLAIELAMARLTVLSLDEIVDRLDDLMNLLRADRQVRAPRHRGIREVVAWSHRLLDNTQRSAWERAAVFVDDFTLDAFGAICLPDGPSASALDVLGGLVDASMVLVDRTVAPTRYRLLEVFRQYAAERFAERTDADQVRAAVRSFRATAGICRSNCLVAARGAVHDHI
jgi:predicted ATPase